MCNVRRTLNAIYFEAARREPSGLGAVFRRDTPDGSRRTASKSATMGSK